MDENVLKLKAAEHVRLVTVFDNYEYRPELETGWGFSCLVKINDKAVFFDTGADGAVLLSNLERLELSPSAADAVVFSHPHFDHTGGLAALLSENSEVTVYGHTGFSSGFQSKLESRSTRYVEVSSAYKLGESAGVTGPVGGGIREQAFFVSTDKGLVVITGCAHPGVVRMVEKAKEVTGEKIYLVLGGFHLGGAPRERLLETAEELKKQGVKKAAPCHCSGDKCRQVFAEVFDDDYVDNGVGRVIEIP
ncbi:MAG: MBL fold metallo-hydrolase [bacterium]